MKKHSYKQPEGDGTELGRHGSSSSLGQASHKLITKMKAGS